MSPTEIAILIKPLAFFVFVAVVLYPIRRACKKWLPEGRLKRVLLFELNRSK